MGAFDDALGGADVAAFAEMGEQILVDGTPVRAIRQPSEAQSELGDGGFGLARSCRFEVSVSDAALYAIKAGAKVTAGGEDWRVAGSRVRGATVELVCIETSGRGKAEF
jgi:hypothetical protein